MSNSDNITNIRSPEFLLTTPDPNWVISLRRRLAGSNDAFGRVVFRTGSGRVVDPGPLVDGRYEYVTITQNTAGTYSDPSQSLFVTISSTSG